MSGPTFGGGRDANSASMRSVHVPGVSINDGPSVGAGARYEFLFYLK